MIPGARTIPNVFVNGASIFSGEIIARLATALMALVVAHFFGSIALGDYGYALALASILIVVPDCGLHLFAVRELSSSPLRLPEIFWGIHWIKLGLTGAVVAFTLFFGEIGIADRGRRILFYVLIGRAVLQTFSQATMAIFKAFERMQYIALQQCVNTAIIVVWVGAAVLLRASLPVVMIGLVAGQFAETCLGWAILWSKFGPGRLLKWDRNTVSTILADCLPIGFTAILLALNLRVDILVLSVYVPSSSLGQFQAAAWFTTSTFLSASLLMSVLFPKLSRLLIGHSAQGSDYVLSLLKNALLITALGALVAWLSAPALLPLFFGKEFESAANILRILAPAMPLVFLNTVLFYVFVAARRRFVCLGTLGFGVIVGAALSLYLSSRYGVAGCAIADVAREFLISGVYLYFLIQGNHARIAGLALAKVFMGATILLALGALLAAPLHLGATWLAAWMVFVVTGTLIALGFPQRRELHLLTDDRL
jgi:O-antigen/teichoic acid export membrane protein